MLVHSLIVANLIVDRLLKISSENYILGYLLNWIPPFYNKLRLDLFHKEHKAIL